MVQKYAHLNATHLLQYANHVNFSSNSFLDTSNLIAENEMIEEFAENKKVVSY